MRSNRIKIILIAAACFQLSVEAMNKSSALTVSAEVKKKAELAAAKAGSKKLHGAMKKNTIQFQNITDDPVFACTNLPKTLQAIVREYLVDPVKFFPAITKKRIIRIGSLGDGIAVVSKDLVALRYANGIYIVNVHTGMYKNIPTDASSNSSLYRLKSGLLLTITAEPLLDNASMNCLQLWDPFTGKCIYMLDEATGAHKQKVSYIEVLADDSIVISYQNGMVQHWRPEIDLLQTLERNAESADSAVSPRRDNATYGFNGNIVTRSYNSVDIRDPETQLCLFKPIVDELNVFNIKDIVMAISDDMFAFPLVDDTNTYQGLCIYTLEQAAVLDLQNLSQNTIAALEKLLQSLEIITYDSLMKKEEVPIILSESNAKIFMELSDSIRSCLASYYHITTAEIAQKCELEGSGLSCIIV